MSCETLYLTVCERHVKLIKSIFRGFIMRNLLVFLSFLFWLSDALAQLGVNTALNLVWHEASDVVFSRGYVVLAGIDIDQDGKGEILTYDPDGGKKIVYLFESSGDNNYDIIWQYQFSDDFTSISGSTPGIMVTDIDNDGFQEIVVIVGSENPDSTNGLDAGHIFEWDGTDNGLPNFPTATFDPPRDALDQVRLGYTSTALDLDNDGNIELVLPYFGGNGKLLSIIQLTSSDLSVGVTMTVEFDENFAPIDTTHFLARNIGGFGITDIDLDGLNEVIMFNFDNNTGFVRVYEGTGPNAYAFVREWQPNPIGWVTDAHVTYVRSLIMEADFDEDGVFELYLSDTKGNSWIITPGGDVATMFDDVNWTKLHDWKISNLFVEDGNIHGGIIGDVDFDNKPDIYFAGNTFGSILDIEYDGGDVTDGDNYSYYVTAIDSNNDVDGGHFARPSNIALSDMDDDGLFEVVVIVPFTGGDPVTNLSGLYVFEHEGLDSVPISVIIAENEWFDIDRDGYADGLLDGTESYNTGGLEIISYIWTINDSVLGTAAQITASLPTGTNQVNLTVTDTNGLSNIATKSISVVLGELPTPVITAASEWQDITGDGFAQGTLDASNSTHPAGFTITGYEWTLNDSTLGTAAQITASLPTGTNQVNLTVTDTNGLSNIATKSISVVLGELPTPVITAESLWLDITRDGFVQGTLNASNSIHPAGYAITGFEWRRNGITIGSESIINTFLPTGTNTVYLIVTDENGLIDSTSKNINVHAQKIQTAGPISSAVSSIGDSLFFASSADDKIYNFDTDGIVRWFLKVGGDIQSTTTIGPNNRIYVGSSDTRLYAFNLNGNFEWDISMGGIVTASPAITSGDILYVGVDNGRLFSLNGSDGSINWNYLTAGPINSSASVGTDGIIYVGSDGGLMYAINPDGSLRWSFITNEPVRSSPALDLSGNIYFGSDDKNFYSLDSDGNENWRFSTGGTIQSSPVISGDGTVYFGSTDSLVYAISASGEFVWSYDAGSAVNGTPTTLPDGKLAIGTDDGRLIVLSSIGELVWYYQTGSSIIAPPLVTNKGMIYVGSTDGSIYGLVDADLASQNLSKMTSAGIWPTFQGNNQRTGFQGDVVAVEDEQATLPTEYSLSDNWPNPFNPKTTISYGLPQQSDVTLVIYNLMGQEIMRWDEQNVLPGYHQKTWNGTNKFGVSVGSGVYLYRLVAGNFVETRKMVFIK
ncbi:T9SS type A sorting domain-containing protein [Candidatus Marinimicrobia bacterium MT.SAG.2]|nr:T9SS type A sorting domain-containing protein [Candidatus Marinimicrobia bacterium MT.SAG.2]